MTASLQAWVHTLQHQAQDIISVDLRPVPGQVFPAFAPGAHIDLHLPNGMVRSYSLCNDSGQAQRYVVGVLRDKASRGGSRCVHEQLRVGMRLPISAPRNHFALHEDAAHTVLVAGGIGVTPLLCMARRLKALGRPHEMLYFARNRQAAAFADELQQLGTPVHWHFDDEAGGPPDLRALLAARRPQSPDTHYYACGPAPLLDSFERHCADLGYAHAHIERFAAVAQPAAADARRSYVVELQRSGKTLAVAPEQTLLQVLRAHQIDVPFSCEEGICGSCETRVLAGVPDHRDMVLTSAEQAANTVMMVCVSGCKSDTLVLDL